MPMWSCLVQGVRLWLLASSGEEAVASLGSEVAAGCPDAAVVSLAQSVGAGVSFHMHSRTGWLLFLLKQPTVLRRCPDVVFAMLRWGLMSHGRVLRFMHECHRICCYYDTVQKGSCPSVQQDSLSRMVSQAFYS